MTDEFGNDEVLEVKPVIPNDWLKLIAVAVSTPIVKPGGSPEDPGTIWCPPINTIGLSGIAKSERIKAIGRAMGLPGVHVVFTATKSPSSFEGAAVPTSEGIVIECTLPAARKCINNGGGLIFFDEANGATPRTQAACLSTLNDRQFGDHMIPPRTRILLAMNPAEHAAGGYALSAPMANRMGHVWYPPPSKESWGDWLNGTKEDIPDLSDWEGRVIRGWQQHWGTVNALMSGFIKREAETVFVNQPLPDDPASSQAWPSYRTWHWALCAMTTSRCVGQPPEMEHDLVHAYCGLDASTRWAAWINDADLPDPEEMLVNGWIPNPHRVDRTYAALNNMASWLVVTSKVNHSKAAQLAQRGWELLLGTYQAGLGDLVVSCAAQLHKAKLGRHGTPAGTAKAAGDLLYPLAKAGFTELAE